MENTPGAGSPWSFQETIRLITPVFLLRLSLLPGSHVSVKSSKLCHSTVELVESCLTTRFPEFSSTTFVERVAMLFLILVDQIGDLEWLAKRTRFPSSEMVRFDETGSETDFPLLATHTIVCVGILLYQMPMYHLSFDPSTRAMEREKKKRSDNETDDAACVLLVLKSVGNKVFKIVTLKSSNH